MLFCVVKMYCNQLFESTVLHFTLTSINNFRSAAVYAQVLTGCTYAHKHLNQVVIQHTHSERIFKFTCFLFNFLNVFFMNYIRHFYVFNFYLQNLQVHLMKLLYMYICVHIINIIIHLYVSGFPIGMI